MFKNPLHTLGLISTSLILFTSCVTAQSSAPATTQAVQLNEGDLVKWDSDEGVARLERSKAKVDFFPLVNHFETQGNRLTCGPASATIILNSFRIGKPEAPKDSSMFDGKSENLPKGFDPLYNKYTQNNFFSDEVNKVKTRAQLYGEPIDGKQDHGLQLDQLARALRAHDLRVSKRVVDDRLDNETIKREFKKNLSTKGDFILVNYARKGLAQPGGGHISPLGAYDEETDSVLVMDVTPNVAPFLWVKTDLLISAMRTKDTVENRGYLLISDKK